MEWQPIETAPKDGTAIIACVAGFEPDVVVWVQIGDKGMFCNDPELFMEEEHFLDYFNGTTYHPTHWMKLPESPK